MPVIKSVQKREHIKKDPPRLVGLFVPLLSGIEQDELFRI